MLEILEEEMNNPFKKSMKTQTKSERKWINKLKILKKKY